MLKNKVKFFKALADGTRLTILSYLLEHGYCACDFSALTEKDQSTVSKHLKVLVEAEILKSEKRGRNIVYTIGDDRTRDLLVSLGINEQSPAVIALEIPGLLLYKKLLINNNHGK